MIVNDSGEYTCKVSNQLGSAESKISLNIGGRDSLDTSSLRPEGLEKIAQLERGRQSRPQDESKTFQKPVFTLPLQNVEQEEGRTANLAARLIPVGDPSLIVEWFKDGQMISSGMLTKRTVR